MKKTENINAQRIGTIIENISGFKMKCIDYRNSMDIDVEFIDSGIIVRNVQWNNFIRGKVKNKYINVYGQCDKYSTLTNTKEYRTWYQMLRRCFDVRYKEEKPTYKDATCCEEWLSFGNFCDWLHSQENFQAWKNLKWSAIDKDILCKGNKTYSPDKCLLVPVNVNNLFVKHDALRGDYPIGVYCRDGRYSANCTNPIENKIKRIGTYETIDKTFESYKEYKENLIKRIANIEYKNGNITKKCRDAMYSYNVEIDD